MKFSKFLPLLLAVFTVGSASAASIDESLLQEPVPLHDGGSVRLGDLIGKKPIYLKFWASWCGTCREQMPHLEAAYREYGDELEFIPVNIWINESEEAIADTVREFGLTVPIAIDEQGTLARAFDFFGTPYHVLIDRSGNIVHTGYAADEELDRRIESIASRAADGLPPIALQAGSAGTTDVIGASQGLVALFFVATWCDWYLEDSRPAMSRACVQGQRTMNRVAEIMPDLALRGIASPLWTTEKELSEYVEKYGVEHALSIDESSDAFVALNVQSVPTLVVLNGGKEVMRTSAFDSADVIVEAIRRMGN